jgi:hypothetical protein
MRLDGPETPLSWTSGPEGGTAPLILLVLTAVCVVIACLGCYWLFLYRPEAPKHRPSETFGEDDDR